MKLRTHLATLGVSALLIAAGVAYLLRGSTAQSATPDDYAYFTELTQEQLSNTQVKLTYVGQGSKATWSLGMRADGGTTLDVDRFVPFEDPNTTYPGEFDVMVCQTAPAQVASLITAAGTVPDVAATMPDDLPMVSFMLLLESGSGDHGFEALLSAEASAALLNAIIPSVDDASDCQKMLRQWSATVHAGPGINAGDADCSGAIDATDPLRMLLFATESVLPNSCLVVGGDPNCDGEADPGDAILDLRYILGLNADTPDGCAALGEHAEH